MLCKLHYFTDYAIFPTAAQIPGSKSWVLDWAADGFKNKTGVISTVQEIN